MALDLVTGYKGTAHITAEDVGAFNAGIVGEGDYVLNSGNKLSASLTSNNTVRILDGDLVMQGRHITLKKDTFEEVTIDNGESGMNRIDLIVARYTKEISTGVENVVFAVIKGTSTPGTATEPAYTSGDILSGDCTLHEMPLYRISLSGLTVGAPEPLFKFASGFNNGFIPYTTEEEDLPSKWVAIGRGMWEVPSNDGYLIHRSSTQGATLFNSYSKMLSKTDHRIVVTQLLLTSMSNGSMHYRIGTLVKEGEETITNDFGAWKQVKLNYENPVVSGSYKGTGLSGSGNKNSLTLNMSQNPKLVIIRNNNDTLIFTDQMDWAGWVDADGNVQSVSTSITEVSTGRYAVLWWSETNPHAQMNMVATYYYTVIS